MAAPDLSLWVDSIDGGAPRQVPGTFDGPVEVASPGYLLYTEQTTLMARQFDPQRLAWLGDPLVLADGVYVRRGGAQANVLQRGSADGNGGAPRWRDAGNRESLVHRLGPRHRRPAATYLVVADQQLVSQIS